MISIIVPVYNCAATLGRCLDSLLNQTYGDVEVVAVDDGSTDGSGVICDRYAAADSRVRVVHTENRGVSEARNTGLAVARGEYAAFVDSDDWADPRMLELLLGALEAGRYDLAMCHFREVQHDEFRPEPLSAGEAAAEEITSRSLCEMLFSIPVDAYRGSAVPYDVVWGKLYRREILEGMRFKTLCAEDAEFNSRLYMRVERAAVVPVPLYAWIQYPQSLHRLPAYDNLDGALRSTVQMYRNILPEFGAEKSQALKRIFLSLLASRYTLSHYPAFEASRAKVESLVAETAEELLPVLFGCRNISSLFKAGIAIFYRLPFTYNIFRGAAAAYAKIKS